MELHIFAQNYKVYPLVFANQNQVLLHVYGETVAQYNIHVSCLRTSKCTYINCTYIHYVIKCNLKTDEELLFFIRYCIAEIVGIICFSGYVP